MSSSRAREPHLVAQEKEANQMKSSTTYLNWFRRLVILGAVVGVGVFAATAGAVGRPPDVQDVAASLSADVNRPPDIQDVATRMSAQTADVFERYAAAHPYGAGLSSSEATRPPDIADVAAQQKLLTAQGVLNSVRETSPNQVGLAWQYLHDSGQIGTVSGSRSTDAPDAFERYAAAHPYGKGLNLTQSSDVNRPPDIQDTALKLQYGSSSTDQSQD